MNCPSAKNSASSGDSRVSDLILEHIDVSERVAAFHSRGRPDFEEIKSICYECLVDCAQEWVKNLKNVVDNYGVFEKYLRSKLKWAAFNYKTRQAHMNVGDGRKRNVELRGDFADVGSFGGYDFETRDFLEAYCQTDFELDIVKLYGVGLTHQEIADMLMVPKTSVDWRIRQLKGRWAAAWRIVNS